MDRYIPTVNQLVDSVGGGSKGAVGGVLSGGVLWEGCCEEGCCEEGDGPWDTHWSLREIPKQEELSSSCWRRSYVSKEVNGGIPKSLFET